MSNRYSPIPNPRSTGNGSQDMDVEMQAAFDYSEDDDDENNVSELQPLNASAASTTVRPSPTQNPPTSNPGMYDFENVDYDYPPPGSPPRPSATALPNEFGNSNGHIPSFDSRPTPGPRQVWIKRVASAVLPSQVAHRLGLSTNLPAGPVGSGTNNDGVFANVTAKPTLPLHIQDGDDTYVVPEDSRPEAPPSYASAQADAVPPYWETTVHAPFSPDSMGEMIIDSLPTGSIFSFCWNMLVSVSFQFVGFLLTYLLHSTHAARLGSRAGLGITLIQYGFALRGRLDSVDGSNGDSGGWVDWKMNGSIPPSFGSAAEADEWYSNHAGNATAPDPTVLSEEQANIIVADATIDWLSFFLMTIGWFILLTSLLGFWRVKRWESGILASQRGTGTTASTEVQPQSGILTQFGLNLGIRGISRHDLFGHGSGNTDEAETVRATIRAEEGDALPNTTGIDGTADPVDEVARANRARLISAALARERRLQEDLRNAGLL